MADRLRIETDSFGHSQNKSASTTRNGVEEKIDVRQSMNGREKRDWKGKYEKWKNKMLKTNGKIGQPE